MRRKDLKVITARSRVNCKRSGASFMGNSNVRRFNRSGYVKWCVISTFIWR
jgi:hypothetical protein